MQFYCTAGRGTEMFVVEEIKQQFGKNLKIISSEGKLYFTVNDHGPNINKKLMNLKTVERVFVKVLHENFSKVDRRGLLTLLHTRLNDKVVWEECLSTLKHLSTCNISSQLNSVLDIKDITSYQCIDVIDKHQEVECLAPNIDTYNKAFNCDTESMFSGVCVSEGTKFNAECQKIDISKTVVARNQEKNVENIILKPGNKRKVPETDTCVHSRGTNIEIKLINEDTYTNDSILQTDYERTVPETGISTTVPKLHYDRMMSSTDTNVKKHIMFPRSSQGTKISSMTNEYPQSTKKRKFEGHTCKDTFRVSCRFSGYARKQLNVQRTSQQMGVLISKCLGWKVDLRHPKHEINIHLGDDTITVGIPLTTIPLSKRPYMKHIGLRTPIAWIMACLLDIGTGDVVLDPMCGCATILFEALQMCKTGFYIGMDKNIAQLRLAIENMAYYGQRFSFMSLIHGDTRNIPLPDSSVDGVITDAPFGQNHVVTGNLHTFYCEMLSECARVVKPKRKIVLLTSADMVDFVENLCSDNTETKSCPKTMSPKTNTGFEEGKDKHTFEEVEGCKYKSSSQIKEDVTEINRQEGNVKFSKNSNFELDLSQLRAPLSLLLKATHHVKLGETEGCIIVLLNQKIK